MRSSCRYVPHAAADRSGSRRRWSLADRDPADGDGLDLNPMKAVGGLDEHHFRRAKPLFASGRMAGGAVHFVLGCPSASATKSPAQDDTIGRADRNALFIAIDNWLDVENAAL